MQSLHGYIYRYISIHAPSRERRTEKIVTSCQRHFNPRSLAGATTKSHFIVVYRHNFNPRSLAGATRAPFGIDICKAISIHAPSRERPNLDLIVCSSSPFQSTLPRGSDSRTCRGLWQSCDFNPRSLAGATNIMISLYPVIAISIHAPSRERRSPGTNKSGGNYISIHAPSRERHSFTSVI